MAEGGGFEPPIEKIPITDFESAAFDHSATLPYLQSFCPMLTHITDLHASRALPSVGNESPPVSHSATLPKECLNFSIFLP